MGFLRFRRTFRIGPGLRLNVSKSGVSASVGRRGLWLTAGPRGTRETIGLPETGISYTEQQRIGDHATVARDLAGTNVPRAEVAQSPGSVETGTNVPFDAVAPASGGSRALIWLALLVLIVVAAIAMAI